MKKLFGISLITVITLFFTFSNYSIVLAGDSPHFVGVKTCGMCHKKDAKGNQLKVWKGSKHAKAYKTLQTAEADKIAKDKGFKTKAVETPECLSCHTVASNVDASLKGKKFKIEDGVQCEACHGAGSKYKKKSIMKDHAKAVAAGLTDFKDKATIQKKCETCHNKKSPSYKKFDFKKMWKEIAHNIPKK
ncbi:MAG: cytochrome C554 [Chlorobi bacterium]|nr:cytochrome C554 [Chlorobiota bacterium]